MINPHETEAFDFLYNFVHKHAEGVYILHLKIVYIKMHNIKNKIINSTITL